MKCKIIVVSDDKMEFENRINAFIKDKTDCQISVSNSRFLAGYTPHTEFVACITYADETKNKN